LNKERHFYQQIDLSTIVVLALIMHGLD